MAPRILPIAALTALTLLTSACGAGTISLGGSKPGSGESGSSAPRESTGGAPASDCSVRGDTFAGDVALARCLTERFWSRRFAASGKTYRPVKAFVAYQGDNGPDCGNEKSVPNNAFYCPVGHFIAYDEVWMKSMYDELGDGAVYVIVPHEFGHAVQAQVMTDFSYNIERELQADCYAGGTISALIDGKELQAEEGDGDELLSNLAAAGDATDAWWRPDAHGTPVQRQKAFAIGVKQGVTAC